MDANSIIAQVLGIIALIVLFISSLVNDKKKVLGIQVISSLVIALQYLFLGAYSGCLINIVCAIRNIIYGKKYENKQAPIWLVIVIIAIMMALSMFTYNGPISLLPMLAISIFTIAVSRFKLTSIRIAEIIASVIMIIYDVEVKAYTGIIMVTVEIIFALVAIIRFSHWGQSHLKKIKV